MTTTKILPAALAVALFAAGGVTHAMAAAVQPKGELSMSQAQQRAKDVIGGGKILASERYGIHHDLYLFDIEKGTSPEQVFVNGEDGSVMVSDGLDSYGTPQVIIGPIHGTGHQKT